MNSFLEHARACHGDKYIYLSPYVSSSIHIKIECPKHGIFEQRPDVHCGGGGCPSCGHEKVNAKNTKTNVWFLQEAKKIHGDRYGYPEEYIGIETLLTILCKEHGPFKQTPHNHLSNHGCRDCRDNSRRLTDEQFLDRANKVHHGKYKYVSIYTNANDYIDILCPIHGLFIQRISSHLEGKGCLPCGSIITGNNLRGTFEEFLKEAKLIHGELYSYPDQDYFGRCEKINIICKMHGLFRQLPGGHLAGHGCRKCSRQGISKLETEWLNYLGIPEENRQTKLKMSFKKRSVSVDAYDPTTNTIYEFYGSYWHGDPKIYNPEKENYRCKKTFGELYQRTMERENLIKKEGYNFVFVWENDWILWKKDHR
jgi:hypothetical protein